MGGVAGLRTGGGRGHGLVVVAQSRHGLGLGNTTGAAGVGLHAGIGASGSLGDLAAVVAVAQRRALGGATGGTGLGTVTIGSLPAVTGSSDRLGLGGSAGGAAAGLLSLFRTGRRLAFIPAAVHMSGGGDGLGIAVTADRTSEHRLARSGTGGLSGLGGVAVADRLTAGGADAVDAVSGMGTGLGHIAQGEAVIPIVHQGKGDLLAAGDEELLTGTGVGIEQGTGGDAIAGIGVGHIPVRVALGLHRHIGILLEGGGELVIDELVDAHVLIVALAGVVRPVDIAEEVVVSDRVRRLADGTLAAAVFVGAGHAAGVAVTVGPFSVGTLLAAVGADTFHIAVAQRSGEVAVIAAAADGAGMGDVAAGGAGGLQSGIGVGMLDRDTAGGTGPGGIMAGMAAAHTADGAAATGPVMETSLATPDTATVLEIVFPQLDFRVAVQRPSLHLPAVGGLHRRIAPVGPVGPALVGELLVISRILLGVHRGGPPPIGVGADGAVGIVVASIGSVIIGQGTGSGGAVEGMEGGIAAAGGLAGIVGAGVAPMVIQVAHHSVGIDHGLCGLGLGGRDLGGLLVILGVEAAGGGEAGGPCVYIIHGAGAGLDPRGADLGVAGEGSLVGSGGLVVGPAVLGLGLHQTHVDALGQGLHPVGHDRLGMIQIDMTALGAGVLVTGQLHTGAGEGDHVIAVTGGGDGLGLAVAADGTAMGPGTGLGTGGCLVNHPAAIGMGAAGEDLQMLQRTADGIGLGAKEGEGKVLAGEEVAGGALGGDALIIVVHGTQLHAVHAEPDHIGAVGGRLVGQGEGMGRRQVDAMVVQVDAVVMVGVVLPHAHRHIAVVTGAEQIGAALQITDVGGSQQHGAVPAAGIAALRLPLDRPALVVTQDDLPIQLGIAGGGEGIAGKDTGVEGRLVLHESAGLDALELPVLGLPAVVMELGIGGDAALPNLEVLHLTGDGVAVSAQTGEGQILAVQPVHGGVLGGGAPEIVVHGPDLRAVHIQIDHVGAVGGDPVGQAIHMAVGIADAHVGQPDAVVVMAAARPLAESQNTAAEQVGGVFRVAIVVRRQDHGASRIGTGPLDAPRPVMEQLDVEGRIILCRRIGGAGDRTGLQRQGVVGVVEAGDIAQGVAGGLPAEGIRLIHCATDAIAPDLDILDGVVDRMVVGAEVGEGEVLTGDPVGGGALRGATDVILVQGADFLAVHRQPDHIGAVGGDLIGQAEHLRLAAVHTVGGQVAGIVVIL